MSSPLQTALLDKLINSPKVKKFNLTLRGGSMHPYLKPSTQAQFRKISSPKLPKIGDIAAIKFKNRLLVHRIIRRRFRNRGWEFFTQGDRLPKGDGWITKDKIAGIMVQPAAFQSAVYYPQILKIKQAFEAEKIDFLFLKGLPLYLYFEKSYPKRILADCDVLIDKQDKSKVEKIFRRQGYRLAETAYSKFHRRLKDKLTEVTYFKVISNCLVAFDVHFEVVFLMNQLGRLDALYPQKSVDEITREFLAEKQQIKIRGQSFPILSPANLIIYLGLHFFHHNFRGWHRLEFWHKVINYYFRGCHCEESPEGGRRGNLIVEKIKHYRLRNFVYPGLIILNADLGPVFPQKIIERIKPDRSSLHYIDKLMRLPRPACGGARNDGKLETRDREDHLAAGINRFKNIFYLSPHPWYRKILVFFNPAVIYSAIWTLAGKLNRQRQHFSL